VNEAETLTRPSLEKLKKRALRCRAWFKLNKLERAALDLTIRVVERVRNSTLANIILGIVNKLRQWIRPSRRERAMEVGRSLAMKIASIAQRWGNHQASAWVEDQEFIFYLGIKWLNTSPIYRYTP